MNTTMRRIRHALIPAAAVLLFGIGGAAQADSYRLYFGSPGASIGFKSGHYGHYGHRGYYPRRHYYKHHYRPYPRYWHGPRHGYYKHGYRHPGRYHGYKHGYRGYKHGYRGHRRHGWRH